jgi:hypothetical protein
MNLVGLKLQKKAPNLNKIEKGAFGSPISVFINIKFTMFVIICKFN